MNTDQILAVLSANAGIYLPIFIAVGIYLLKFIVQSSVKLVFYGLIAIAGFYLYRNSDVIMAHFPMLYQ
ncbi:hypothetical protein CQA49_06655 [Helicobacter sp. MIT 00-7814]|uniref:hypothetical protein n=1 Tax=unclassified Helicobacter TaxID=2593540 RepID=UPI000E1F4BD4|nr:MULTISPECIES: hypothetical protein [unclassified Helicobacter]RDU53323.1 hypothetical protein CQA49_06655 [Helicobacter sp. MIT 00-7814]RDU54144.1 hypothetical protein CQA37_05895 [Helicobacter sp. MIT 99-10781]